MVVDVFCVSVCFTCEMEWKGMGWNGRDKMLATRYRAVSSGLLLDSTS